MAARLSGVQFPPCWKSLPNLDMGVSKNRGTPKWMVIMENPIKWMIWGYHYFWKHPHDRRKYGSGWVLCKLWQWIFRRLIKVPQKKNMMLSFPLFIPGRNTWSYCFTHQTKWLEYQAAIQEPSYFDFIQRSQLRGKSLMLSIKVTSPAEGGRMVDHGKLRVLTNDWWLK